jgi:tripartite-type tricarboxylate transporter receptor subunit TctC
MNRLLGSRRRVALKYGSALAAAIALPALAQRYPEKLIRLVVPSAAGGAPDLICRVVVAELTRRLKWAFVVDNRPGGGGNVGMLEVVTAAPDGYTLGYGNVVTLAINRSLFKKLPYDPNKDLAPVALLGSVQNALVVRPGLAVTSVKGLIDHAKANPGKLTVGSAGVGTTSHLGAELFKSMTNTFMVHVPYRGSVASLQDMMGGRVDLMFDNLSSVLPYIEDWRVRALAVSGPKRTARLPELPTIAESGVPGYESVAWGGFVAPAGVPKVLITQLNGEVNFALGQRDVAERLAAMSFETYIGPPERLFERAWRETPIWAAVVKRSGAHAE